MNSRDANWQDTVEKLQVLVETSDLLITAETTLASNSAEERTAMNYLDFMRRFFNFSREIHFGKRLV